MKRFALVLTSLVVTACVTPPPPVPVKKGPEARDFYPLTVGSQWSYEVNLLGEKSAVEVKLLREVNGAVEDSTGNQLLADAFGVRDQHRYLLRNPVEPGTRWTNVVSVSSVEHYEILAVDQPCESPAGKWSGCVVVESKNQVEQRKVLVNEMTFAPGVGLVQLATTLDDSGNRIPQSALKLTKYSIVPPPAPPPAPAAAKP